MQNNNGEEGATVAADDLHDGPIADNDTRVIEVDSDMVAAEDEVVLRDGAGSSYNTQYALLPRTPAQVHERSPGSSTDSSDHKNNMATTSARLEVDVSRGGLDIDSDMVDDDDDSIESALRHVCSFVGYPFGTS